MAAGPGTKRLVRALAVVLAVAALAFCVVTLVRQWSEVRDSVVRAHPGWLVVAGVLSFVSMASLAVLWQRCLAVFGHRAPLGRVVLWYFGGELGKYLPGSVWSVVGRGELARRDGAPRGTAYATTVVSLGAMCGGAVLVALAVVPWALDGPLRAWSLLGASLAVVLVVVVALPAVSGRLLALLRRVSRGRVDLEAPSWPAAVGLVLWSLPAWVALGLAAVAIDRSFDFGGSSAQLAAAAVTAWVVGFLFIPVPAGAGPREVVFVLLSGLAAPPATVVAATSRLLLLVVDVVAGAVSLVWLHRTRPTPEAEEPQRA